METPVLDLSPRLLLVVLILSGSAVAMDRPNVVLFMADDMGMGDTSAYQDFTGNADDVQLATPSMERLARMGVRFTDAHTPASRCTPTRYGLLTGRYPWRNRLKWWVLYGSQGDPMIEPKRPTLATLFRDAGYGTAIVGKWHVGLRYRRADGEPAAGWEDADLSQPLHTTPLDHGFEFARFTSRSHGTSGPDFGSPKGMARNGPEQSVGPGHIHGRDVIAATGEGKTLVAEGPDAYVLTKLGSRHSDHALEFLRTHEAGQPQAERPFFLYYPANANHSPYTPDETIGGVPVAGASRTKSGEPMDARHDLIYENDVALGRLLDYLAEIEDPRHPGKQLLETTLVIFTSDNGAEKNSDIATGPFRSHKGSCYEGGHRVPFLVSWAAGGIGDGNSEDPGASNPSPISLTDLFATFSEILGVELPNIRAGEKGGEDSFSVLSALRGEPLTTRPPLFFSDHKEANKTDAAVLAMRVDYPPVGELFIPASWKVFFDAGLVRQGIAQPFELYDLASDSRETTNRISEPELQPLVQHLSQLATRHRNAGGHRLTAFTPASSITFAMSDLHDVSTNRATLAQNGLTLTLTGVQGDQPLTDQVFKVNERGLGISGGQFEQVDQEEALLLTFDRDVVIHSAAIVAGNGVCGGFYQVADHAPLAIYCIDADNDAKEQQGLLSDLGVLPAGQTLRLDSSPHYGTEAAGRWRLQNLTVTPLD